ncbi:hypothetical protein FHU10_4959 [Serratia fonticola]|jgi:hypothetical protein|uniref:Uncharacterized protein n=1 Tax=Serratia fonticola TaxID=47917 RepID=A0A542D3Z3_SERFO|nr:hypothetical protein [Serratia fonticola]TQI80181.1 hypothetical protein FHU09_2744 [Serratia fonticola]TQI97792.1 hypothetical protein FHU11_3299 [Serratia fonticola]TVZ72290.1 hypothetical protein FHU10_4959 [Serratia fonticola]
MSDSERLQELLQRIAALEAREQSLTAASNAYQAIITTILGNLDKSMRDNVIAMIDQAHEIAYARAAHRCDEPQKRKIKQADDVAQRMFMVARGKAAQSR